MAKRVGNNGNHGVKGKSGRKPKEATVLKRRLIENKMEEADASFAFLVDVRDNSNEPTAIRLEAAKTILDRVLGKPTQQNNVNIKGEVDLNVIEIVTYDGDPA